MHLICYLSNGYPNLEHSIGIADDYIEAGCDVIEVDFPCDNPYLDSPLIQNRMLSALKNNDNYDDYMATIERIKEKHPDKRYIVLVYERTVLQIGFEKFADFCLRNELLDVIYIGQRQPKIRQYLMDKGIRIASFIQYHLPEEDIEAAKATNGFIYLQAKPKDKLHPRLKSLHEIVKHLRETHNITRPIYAGVGIRDEDDIKMAKLARVDGVFIGSTILKLQDDRAAMKERIRSLKAATQ